MTAPTIHTMRHGRRLDNGDVELTCFCEASVTGPETEALDLYRRHMSEPVLPQEAKS
jgi:hypothetical protein